MMKSASNIYRLSGGNEKWSATYADVCLCSLKCHDLPEPVFCVQSETNNILTAVYLFGQEYKRKQLEEQRQSERLQRQLQQEHAYLVSLQQQQQEKKPQLYHYNKNLEPNNKPTWAREVAMLPTLNINLLYTI